MTPCIWLGTTHPCNPPNYGLRVNLLFFMMCICKHCFPPMLLAFAMKCCTKMPCPLPHNHYCCLLSSPVCLPHLLICTCLISSPIVCPSSSVLCWCLLGFFLFTLFLLSYHALWRVSLSFKPHGSHSLGVMCYGYYLCQWFSVQLLPCWLYFFLGFRVTL